MRNLLYGSIVVIGLLFTSCAPAMVKNFSKQPEKAVLARADFYPTFDHQTQTAVYNLQIDFRKKHFSGLLVLQPQADSTYRAVFTSYFGLTLFDFELGKNLFTVHYCMEGLNNKRVIATFKSDFWALFLYDLPNNKIAANVYTADDKSEVSLVYKTQVNNKKAFYKVNKQQEQTIEMQRSIAGKTLFTLSPGNSVPSNVIIHHKLIGLRLTMDRLP